MAVVATTPAGQAKTAADAAGEAQQHAHHDGPADAAAATGTAAKAAALPPPLPPGAQTVTIIDGSSGERHEVVIPGSSKPKLPADQRLLQMTPQGAIPQIARGRHARRGALRQSAPARGRAQAMRHASPSSSAASASAPRPPPTRSRICRRRSRSPSRPMAAISKRSPCARARDKARAAAAGADGAIRLSEQRPRPAHAAHHAERRTEPRAPALADGPLPGLCRTGRAIWARSSPVPSRR